MLLRQYILRLGLVLAIVSLTSWMAYNIVMHYDRLYYHAMRRNEFLFKQDTTNYDVLFLGSSRMQNSINPAIFDTVTGLRSFNAGLYATHLLEMKMTLDAYLTHHKPPRYIIISLDFSSIDTQKYIAYDPLYLTCDDVPPVEKALRKEGVHTDLYRIIPFLKLVELNDYDKTTVLRVLRNQDDRDGEIYYKGFISNYSDSLHADTLGPALRVVIMPEALQGLKDLVATAKRDGSRLIFTYAPEYNQNDEKNYQNFTQVMNCYRSIAQANNIPFLRNDSLDICHDRSLFSNNGHFNRKGAVVYSQLLGKQLRQKHLLN